MKQRNFNEIYEKMINQKDPMLDILQKRKITAGIIFIAILVAALFSVKFFKSNPILLIVFAIIGIVAAIIYLVSYAKYRKLYKNSVIRSLVKAYSSGLDFNSQKGISMSEYNRGNYKEDYEDFYSEDLISGSIDDEFTIKMSEVRTEKEEITTDSDGHTQTERVIVFQGIYGFIDVKDKFLPYFEITSNSFFGKYRKSRIEVDSAAFEKHYDLNTEDKIRTMEIFTADLIEQFNQFRENLNTPIQVKIQNGTLYFRLRMKDSFEAPSFGKTLDFQTMYHDFQLIDEPLKLFSKIFENAKDVQE